MGGTADALSKADSPIGTVRGGPLTNKHLFISFEKKDIPIVSVGGNSVPDSAYRL